MRALVDQATQLVVQHGISVAAAAGVAIGCWLLLAARPAGPRFLGAALILAGSWASIFSASAVRSATATQSVIAVLVGVVFVIAVSWLLGARRVAGSLIAYGLIAATVALVAAVAGQRFVAGIVLLTAGPTIAALARHPLEGAWPLGAAIRFSSPLATALAGAAVLATLHAVGQGVVSSGITQPVNSVVAHASGSGVAGALLIGGCAVLLGNVTGERRRLQVETVDRS